MGCLWKSSGSSKHCRREKLRVSGLGILAIVENQMDKKMQHVMDIMFIQGFFFFYQDLGLRVY